MAELRFIKGLDGFLVQLEQLPKDIGRNVLKGAVQAGAAKLKAQAIHLAPELDTPDRHKKNKRIRGALKNSIYQKAVPELSGPLVQVAFVGVRTGKKKGDPVVSANGKISNVDAYYWKWVEFGHFYVPPRPDAYKTLKITQKRWREVHKTWAKAIWIEPRSFMRPAFSLAKDEALLAMQTYLETRIPARARALGLTFK